MSNTIERILKSPPFLNNPYFHVKDGLYFLRNVESSIGTVTIIKFEPWHETENGVSTGLVLWDKKFEITLGPNEWASIVAQMSVKGETMEAYNSAFNFHILK